MLRIEFCNGVNDQASVALTYAKRTESEWFNKLGLLQLPYTHTPDYLGGISMAEHGDTVLGIIQRHCAITGRARPNELSDCMRLQYVRLHWDTVWRELRDHASERTFVEAVNNIANSKAIEFPSAPTEALGAALQTAQEILELIDGTDQQGYALVPITEFSEVPDDDIAGTLSTMFRALNT